MQRACDSCRQPYEAKRPSSKFCSAKCRTRASRGQVVTLPAKAEQPAPPADTTGSVAAATRKELDAAERTDTALGQACLALAERLDARQDTGSAVAALTREWRATLGAATANATARSTPLDELRGRREQRLRGA